MSCLYHLLCAAVIPEADALVIACIILVIMLELPLLSQVLLLLSLGMNKIT
jgi:hypothetical protein